MKFFRIVKSRIWAILLIIIPLLFFYQSIFFFKIPFPGDLLIAEYNPWKTYSYLGYNPGSYPNKAQYFDVIRQFYPEKIFSLSLIQEFDLPLWNPYNFSGSPLLANFQSAVFYPPGIIYLLLNMPLAWSILVILQPILSFYFTYLYMRKLNVSREGSILSALSYGFSYFMIVWLEYNTVGHVIAYLPLVLLSIENLLTKKTLLWNGVFVFSLVSLQLGGHIQVAGYTLVFVVLYLLVRAGRKQLVTFFSLLLLSVGISAVQLFPGVELISSSARSSHEYSFILQKILIQPHQLVMLLVPDFFGNPATRNYFLLDTYVGKVTSIGLISLFFASVMLFLKKNIFVKFFLTAAVIVFLLITLNPLTRFLYSFNIPFFSSSSPTLSTFLMSFSLSVLAGFGFDAVREGKVSGRKISLVILGFISVFVLMWAILLLSPELLKIQNVSELLVSKKNLMYESLLLAVVMILVGIGLRFKEKIVIILFILICLQTAELWRSFNKFNPFVPKELVFPSSEITSFLQKTTGINRFWGYKAAQIEANFATAYSLFSPDGLDPLYPKQYGEFIYLSNTGNLIDKFDVTTRTDAVISKKGELMGNKNRLKVLDTIGVGYILDRVENGSTIEDFPADRFKKIYQNNGWTIFKNLNAAPRFFLTSSYKVFSGKLDFETKFNKTDFDPSKTLLLEKDLEIKFKEDREAKVSINTYSPNKIVFNTLSSEDQLLFLSDTFFPGWKGSIDRKPSEIIRADYTFRAMNVPKGKHTVVMEYKPESFSKGTAVSLISLATYLGIIIFAKKKRYN